jgi:hypothetical protein
MAIRSANLSQIITERIRPEKAVPESLNHRHPSEAIMPTSNKAHTSANQPKNFFENRALCNRLFLREMSDLALRK